MPDQFSPHSDSEVVDSAKRYYGLDFIRVSMLLLGVVIHVAASFVEGPGDVVWPYRDPNPTPWAGIIVLGIHIFRMPTFFVMAGFFAALIQDRKGLVVLARNRFFRIAIPFAVGWVILFPIVNFSFLIGVLRMLGSDAEGQTTGAAIAVAVLSNPWGNPQPIHLWFLYYLLMIYVIALSVVSAIRFAPASARNLCTKCMHELMQGRVRFLRIPILAVVTWVTLLPMKAPSIDTPNTFMPQWHVLLCYAFFFAVGWAVFLQRGMIDSLKAWAVTRLICGVIALLISLAFTLSWYGALFSGDDISSPKMQSLLFASQAFISVTVWLLIFGGVGLAERIMRRPRRIVRYMCDSSYWIYLVHLPICVLVVVALRDWNAPGMTKISTAIGLSVLVSLLSYEAVRCTITQRNR